MFRSIWSLYKALVALFVQLETAALSGITEYDTRLSV